MIPPDHHRGLRRREFMRLALAGSAAVTLAACAPNPLITADQSPKPQPTLDDARRQTAQSAADLAALATACAGLEDADEAFAAWCTALAAQHQAHLSVLCQADPLGGVLADPTPIEQITAATPAVPAAQAEAMQVLAQRHAELAELTSSVAATQSGGSDADQTAGMALLWISQWLCAQVAATAFGSGDAAALSPAPVQGEAVPARTEMGDAAQARQVVLSHQRALVFGLQALYGRADYTQPIDGQLAARLSEAMRERDATAAAITAGGATPEPQPPEYAMPGEVTDPSQTAQIWGALELAVMNAWARLAAVDAAGRADASQQALTQAGRARDLGTALPFWPGWV